MCLDVTGNGGNEMKASTARRYEDNIKIDLREIGCECGKWIELDQDHV
jgi:hypothetical protein